MAIANPEITLTLPLSDVLDLVTGLDEWIIRLEEGVGFQLDDPRPDEWAGLIKNLRKKVCAQAGLGEYATPELSKGKQL